MFAKTALIGLFAAFAAAQLHVPVSQCQDLCNPIRAPLNEAIVAGTPFTIKWDPTTTNTVSLLLLKGPSNNIVPIGEPIAEGIANSGSLSWTPPSEYGPGDSTTTGYGIQIVDDVTGIFQYSNQFGITIPEDLQSSSAASSSSVESSTKGFGQGYGEATPSSTPAVTSAAQSSESAALPTTIPTPSFVASYAYPSANSSIAQATGSLTAPSQYPNATSTGKLSEFTGAASAVKAGLGLAAGVAGMFFML